MPFCFIRKRTRERESWPPRADSWTAFYKFDSQSKERWRLNAEREGKRKEKKKKKEEENKPKRIACVVVVMVMVGREGKQDTSRSRSMALSSPFRAGHQLIIGANQSILYVSSSLRQRWLQSNRIEIDSSRRGEREREREREKRKKLWMIKLKD